MQNFLFWKIVKIEVKNESCELLFQEDAWIA